MALSDELISQFAKVVNKNNKQSSETTVYGTVVTDGNGNKYVKLDGSDQLTPLSDNERPSADSTTANANNGERVSVLIKDHSATVTGNISSPSVRSEDFDNLENDVTDIKKFDIVIAEKVQANEGYIKKLQTDKADIGDLTAANAKITELETKKASVEDLNAAKADITNLKATKIDAEVANAKFATIENLNATNANISDLEANKANVADLTAANAKITELETKKLSTAEAEIKFANIDFTNITEAAVSKLFSDSGIIKDLVVSEGHITGELVGVTIKGDIIEGGTVKADKLVVKGSDGLFYKLNTDGITTTAEQTEYNSLNGSVITAQSITAEKINVDDLVAFDATIGGFHITNNSLYSGVKSSAINTTRGVFLGNDGQIAFGDSSNFIKYYKDTDGKYKLAISAESLKFSATNKSVQETIKSEVTGYVSSRGENLVTNGTASLGNNTNFSFTEYDGTEQYYSAGSFKCVGRKQLFSDEFIPIDINQRYTFSYHIKTTNTAATYYDALIMYDADKKLISWTNVAWVDGSTTVLTQDLNNGDTIVHLQNVAGFDAATTSSWKRGFIVWNYKNSKGYEYGTETYSQNVYSNLWDDGTAIDIQNNTITLKAPWSKGKISAGTSLSQCWASGGFQCFHSSFKISEQNSWVEMTGNIVGVGGNHEANKFFEGTAFVRVGWLLNFNNQESCTTWLSSISLSQNASAAELEDVRKETSTTVKTIENRVSAIETNADSVSASVSSLRTVVDDANNKVEELEKRVNAQITEESVNLQIDKKLQNGATKVETSTGFKFDENGLKVSKTGSSTDTRITENGMTVNNIENGETMLTANKDGVNATNLKATTYLIIGEHSRFENYGTDRTGCFWIGG